MFSVKALSSQVLISSDNNMIKWQEHNKMVFQTVWSDGTVWNCLAQCSSTLYGPNWKAAQVPPIVSPWITSLDNDEPVFQFL